MTLLTANRMKLSRAIPEMLVAATSLRFDLAVIPDGVAFDADEKLIDGYGIVTPLPGVPDYGTLEDEWCVLLQYQVTNVGQNADQAQWTADRSREALTSRDPATGNDWTNPITVSDALVIDRRLREEGGPEPSGGGLWQVVDTYDLEVIAQ